MYRVGPSSESEKEIIREILLKYSGSAAGYYNLEKELKSSSLAQLQRIQAAYHHEAVDMSESQQRIDEIETDRLWTRFFFKNPGIRETTANRNMIFDFALSLTEDGVVKFQHLDEAAKTLEGLDRQKVKRPPTAANLKQDEEILRQFCRTNQLEPNSAALNLLRQEFGAGFDSTQINQALQSGLINMGPASTKILQEAAKQRQDFLINEATAQELRQAAHAESEVLAKKAQQQHAAQQIKTREQAEVSYGHPVLPETNSEGVKLDSVFFKKLADSNIKLFRQYCTKFGFAAITARLNQVR